MKTIKRISAIGLTILVGKGLGVSGREYGSGHSPLLSVASFPSGFQNKKIRHKDNIPTRPDTVS